MICHFCESVYTDRCDMCAHEHALHERLNTECPGCQICAYPPLYLAPETDPSYVEEE